MVKTVTCPACGQADRVDKVSTLYIAGIEKSRSNSKNESELLSKYNAQTLALGSPALSKRLKPPASSKELPTRPLHPDMVVIVFSIFIPFFLIGILNSQQVMVAPVAILLVVAYAIYFWQRKKLIAKHERQKALRQASIERVNHGIERWMNLYYCERDDGVFFPGKQEISPADQMLYYLMQG